MPLDSSLSFLADGYLFGTRRFRRHDSDFFSTRILGRRALIVYGHDAAHMFYEGGRFGRERSMPTSVVRLLQDHGSVQSLSGAPHEHRKSMFVSLLSDDAAVDRVGRLAADEWLRAVDDAHGPFVALDVLSEVLTRVAVRWVGLDPERLGMPVDRLAAQLRAMVDNAGSFAVPNWVATLRRRQTEEWAQGVVEAVRSGETAIGENAILRGFAEHRDENGALLPTAVAAVELINVLRPVVAVARFVVFSILALDRHPGWRSRVAASPEDARHFTNEVRRFYPFFPVVGGRARRAFTWRDQEIDVGDWVMLDLYATNHDARIWSEPGRFRPERFEAWDGDPNTLIPQGAGDVAAGHRCPGEKATIEIMAALAITIAAGTWSLPPQDTRISLRRFPAAPESGLLMQMGGSSHGVRPREIA